MTAARQLFDVQLQPAAGSRFQPTGFPDLGAATFDKPVPGTRDAWVKCLLVESAQSMANRLEGVAWDAAAQAPDAALDGMPYVRVSAADDGRFLTSSRQEAHRLASAFVKDSTLDGVSMKKVLGERLGLRDETPLAPREIAAAILALDPLCLVHGVFFADKDWPGQPKVARAVTGFIEAVNVREAVSGGVKRDAVRHSVGEGAGATEGYGSIPYHRMEYTAEQITASFAIDLAQIASYGLGDAASELLATIARWEIRRFIDGGLRLRTACDLLASGDVVDRDGTTLGTAADLAEKIRELTSACGDQLGEGGPIEVVWTLPKSAKAKAKAKAEAEDAADA